MSWWERIRSGVSGAIPGAEPREDGPGGVGGVSGLGGLELTTDEERLRAREARRTLEDGVPETMNGLFSDVVEGFAHVTRGLHQLLRGEMGGGLQEVGAGFAQATAGAVVDAALLAGVRTVSAVQVIAHAERLGRPPDALESAVLRSVFGDGIDLSQVRIKEGRAGVLSASDRPFTSGNTIYMKGERADPLWMATLVHEGTHVWQYQNGGVDYQSKAVAAQWFGDGYDWRATLARGGGWATLEPEGQAQFVHDAWMAGFFDAGDGGGRFVDAGGGDHTGFAQRVSAQLRRGLGAP